MTKNAKFSLAIMFQVIVMSIIIALKLVITTSGTEVLLPILPIDPRDPLRGDYVSFRYEITEIDGSTTDGHLFKEGEPIYVTLFTTGERATLRQARSSVPMGDVPFLKGVVTRVDDTTDTRMVVNKSPYAKRYTVNYGIEQYFIPEGTGRSFPTSLNMYARVALDANGNAVIKQLLVDGKPWP